jgi:hypothetical protein
MYNLYCSEWRFWSQPVYRMHKLHYASFGLWKEFTNVNMCFVFGEAQIVVSNRTLSVSLQHV